MKKIARKPLALVNSLRKMIRLNSIKTFTEKPSMNAEQAAVPGAPPINHATELFERFTADITRDRRVFSR